MRLARSLSRQAAGSQPRSVFTVGARSLDCRPRPAPSLAQLILEGDVTGDIHSGPARDIFVKTISEILLLKKKNAKHGEMWEKSLR